MATEGDSKTPLKKEFAPPDNFAAASRGRDHDGGSDYPLGGRWRGV